MCLRCSVTSDRVSCDSEWPPMHNLTTPAQGPTEILQCALWLSATADDRCVIVKHVWICTAPGELKATAFPA